MNMEAPAQMPADDERPSTSAAAANANRNLDESTFLSTEERRRVNYRRFSSMSRMVQLNKGVKDNKDDENKRLEYLQLSPRKRKYTALPETSYVVSAGSHECPICMEPRDSSVPHRSVSLRCGHLFGQGCLMNWFKRQEKRCPQCNGRACQHDVRPVKCISLSAIDLTDEHSNDPDNARPAKRRRLNNSSGLRFSRFDLNYNGDVSDSESGSDLDQPGTDSKLMVGLAIYSLFVNVFLAILWGITK